MKSLEAISFHEKQVRKVQFECLRSTEAEIVEQFFEPMRGCFTFAFKEVAIVGSLVNNFFSEAEIAPALMFIIEKVSGVNGIF